LPKPASAGWYLLLAAGQNSPPPALSRGAFPMSEFDPKKFVNREKELDLVMDKVSRLARGEPFAPHERVIHFIGPSDIGKSWLLEKCYRDTRDVEQCAPIFVKLDALTKKRGEFVENFLIAVDKEFSGCLKIPTQIINGKSQSRYGADLTLKINRYAERCITVLFFDEINMLNRAQLQGVEDQLFRRLVHDNGHLVLVTAGRSSPSMLNDFALRPSLRNTFHLSTFNEITTRKQLETLGPGVANLAGKVMELSNGIPGNTIKLVEYAVGDPPDIPELPAVQSMLADVKDGIENRFHPIIEIICILQVFFPEDVVPIARNHPALGEEWDEARLNDVFRELQEVQVGPGGLINWSREKKGWVMDEPTRALFERELQMRDPELWRKLHCTAYKMYKYWGDTINSQLHIVANHHWQCLKSAGCTCDDVEVEIEL